MAPRDDGRSGWVSLERPTGGLLAAALAANRERAPPPAIGLVCMTKRPTRLETWLRYHHEACGIRRFYLRIEDTPELSSLLGSPPWAGLVEASYSSGHRDYLAQMDRQSAHIASVLPSARRDGVDFLLHIDDDELLYCPHGLEALHDELARAPPSAACLHMDNLEAVYPRAFTDADDPFVETVAFRNRVVDFCAYSNGKSFGRTSERELAANGPHVFHAGLAGCRARDTHFLHASVACVLHYESPTLGAWRRKYEDLARRHGEGGGALRERMPSPFYSQSIDANAALLRASASGSEAERRAADDDAAALYAKWKLMPSTGLPPPPPGAPPVAVARHGIVLLRPPIELPSSKPEPEPEPEPLALLQGMLRMGGVAEQHAAALLEAGATARGLLACGKPGVEEVARKAGLPLGQRLRLWHAVRDAAAQAASG